MIHNTSSWRLLINTNAKAVDLFAYPSALVEGRIAGKYMLSHEKIPDTLVVQTFTKKGILAGADTEIDRDRAHQQDIQVAKIPRSGRGGPKSVGTLDYADLIKHASRKFTSAEPDPDDPAVLLYTSGTTGNPKGVMLTHRNFIAQTELVDNIMPMYHKDTVVLVLPLFHVYGLSNGLVCGTRNGCAMSLIPQYSPAKLLDTITSTKATLLIAVPSMYMHLLQISRARKTEIPKSLRLCVSGGAPLPMKTLEEFMELFQTQIAEGYGLTETTSAVSLNKTGEQFKAGSIGPASPGVEMKVVDFDGNDVPDGTEGEILIKGEVVTTGYWNNQEATDEVIKDLWFATGDLGYRDADGFFFITDRKKDLIVRGGFNISPREVEEVIMKFPPVEEAAVVAVKDKRDRETVKAFVVLKDGMESTSQDILQYCREELAEYKIPKIVEFTETLPKSATGKVLRKELRNTETVDKRLILQEEDASDE